MKEGKTNRTNGHNGSDHENRILAAASEIFLEKGYEETSTADIARRASVSKRELYSNFADKRDILTAVITQLQSQMQVRADISLSSCDELRTVLLKTGTNILKFIRSEKFSKLFRIVAAESFRDPVTAGKFYELGPGRGRGQTAAFMRRQMKGGNLRKSDPLQAADDFLDLVISSRQLTAIALGQQVRGRATNTHVRHAVNLFLHYYGNGDAPVSTSRRCAKPKARAAKASGSGTQRA
jgi:AcrR family transcriptional regulator